MNNSSSTDATNSATLEYALTNAHSGDTVEFDVSGTFTLPHDFDLPAGTLTFDAYGSNVVIKGAALTDPSTGGAASLTVGDSINLGGSLTLEHANTYTGTTSVGTTSGTLRGAAVDAFGVNSAVQLTPSQPSNLGGAGSALLDLGGYDQHIGSLSDNVSGGTESVTNSVSTAATLTLGGGNLTGTFHGVIQDGAGVLALNKVGAGTETLTGADTYTGGTTITGGTLVLAAAESMRISGAVTSGAAGTGGIAFAGSAATPAILALSSAAQPASGGTFGHTLSNFGNDDAIDLQGVIETGAAYDAASGVLTLTGPTTEKFVLSRSAATSFTLARDGHADHRRGADRRLGTDLGLRDDRRPGRRRGRRNGADLLVGDAEPRDLARHRRHSGAARGRDGDLLFQRRRDGDGRHRLHFHGRRARRDRAAVDRR